MALSLQGEFLIMPNVASSILPITQAPAPDRIIHAPRRWSLCSHLSLANCCLNEWSSPISGRAATPEHRRMDLVQNLWCHLRKHLVTLLIALHNPRIKDAGFASLRMCIAWPAHLKALCPSPSFLPSPTQSLLAFHESHLSPMTSYLLRVE